MKCQLARSLRERGILFIVSPSFHLSCRHGHVVDDEHAIRTENNISFTEGKLR